MSAFAVRACARCGEAYRDDAGHHVCGDLQDQYDDASRRRVLIATEDGCMVDARDGTVLGIPTRWKGAER